MKHVRLDSTQNLEATSPSERPPLVRSRSERHYLSDQAANAKTAMADTLHDMNRTLKRMVDVRSYAKRHPWLVIGSAIAAGCVAGAVLATASRKTTEKAGESTENESQADGLGPETPRIKTSSWFSSAAIGLAGIVQSVIVNSMIAAAVATPGRPEGDVPFPDDLKG